MPNFQVKVCVVGLGYVGLPLAIEFAKKGVAVYGFDVNKARVEELKNGKDSSNEVSSDELAKAKAIEYSSEPSIIKKANFLIVAVPTPVNDAKQPDLSLVEAASRVVGENMQKGAIVVYESTVYPGVTEDICLPLLEKSSGMKAGADFEIGYSPERMNPGDREHSVDKIIKVVSGMDEESSQIIADTYSIVCAAGVHRAPNIKTAEAAKVIENIQRDLNIALMNELSLIFHRLDINTQDVLEAASTKWNFHKYQPGLVGGHCLHKNQLLFLQNTGHMKVEPIGSYIENLFAEGKANEVVMGKAKIFSPKIPINVLTFNVEQKRTELKPVLAFSSRQEEQLLEITTTTNQKIKISPMHPMMIVEQGEFLVKHAKDLTLSDRLPVIFDLPEKPVEPIDIIDFIDESTIKKTRVKLIKGQWRDYKKQLNIKRHTGQKASGFYLHNYLPLDVYLQLEAKRIMPVKRDDLLLITGYGPSYGQIKAVIQPTKNFFRLLGYYLSEGCITKDKSYRVRWSFNEEEKEYLADLRDCLRELGVKWSEYDVKIDKGYQIKVSNRFLALVFEDILKLGRNCYEKAIFDEYVYAPIELKTELIKGLLRGDGDIHYVREKRNYQKNGKQYCHWINVATAHYFSISPKLFQQVCLMLLSLKITFSIDKNRPLLSINGHKNLERLVDVFDGRDRKKLLDYFENKSKFVKSKKYEQHNGYLTVGIKSIQELPGEIVYSLETQDNKTLVTDYGLITHNCIGVDPYYLTYRAQELGYHSQVILSGRRINDSMGGYVAELMIKGLAKAGKKIKLAKVLVLGLTFKENVKDTRNSKVKDIIKKLKEYDIDVLGFDPLVEKEEAENKFKVRYIDNLKQEKVDGVILAVLHNDFKNITLNDLQEIMQDAPVLVDVKSFYLKQKPQDKGFIYSAL